jgi:hypothetical protein
MIMKIIRVMCDKSKVGENERKRAITASEFGARMSLLKNSKSLKEGAKERNFYCRINEQIRVNKNKNEK